MIWSARNLAVKRGIRSVHWDFSLRSTFYLWLGSAWLPFLYPPSIFCALVKSSVCMSRLKSSKTGRKFTAPRCAVCWARAFWWLWPCWTCVTVHCQLQQSSGICWLLCLHSFFWVSRKSLIARCKFVFTGRTRRQCTRTCFVPMLCRWYLDVSASYCLAFTLRTYWTRRWSGRARCVTWCRSAPTFTFSGRQMPSMTLCRPQQLLTQMQTRRFSRSVLTKSATWARSDHTKIKFGFAVFNWRPSKTQKTFRAVHS